MKVTETDALNVTDVQNDFCPGGKLGVPGGDEVVGVLNRIMPLFRHVIATQDFHPAGHGSFLEQGGPWPEHCVQGTPGADLHPDLDVSRIQEVVQKGTDTVTDAYSGFLGTDLAERLRRREVRRLFVGGLATDYCVKNTALDALRLGFEVVVLTDACRAVDVAPGDGEAALKEIVEAGGVLATSDELHS